MKFSKVRTIDYRPPGAGTPSPLERTTARPGAVARQKFHSSPPVTGMDHWNRIEASMAAEHDRSVSAYSTETAQLALKDISIRKTQGRDPETIWIRHRKAALMRKLHAPELIRK